MVYHSNKLQRPDKVCGLRERDDCEKGRNTKESAKKIPISSHFDFKK